MDTITHGIAGALLSKAALGGHDLLPATSVNKRRLITWVVTLGAMFPDSDVLRDFFSDNPMLIITWHRSITHSLVCLPIWAILLAALTRAVARWRKWESPSFAALCGLWGIGILSHIFLDLVTTFGTMIWSPLKWSRPAWDILFIIDFAFTAILLVPQWLAWTFADPKRMVRRGLIMWLIFTPLPFVVAKIAEHIGTPISGVAIIVATLLVVLLFLLPAVSATGWGQRVPYLTWNRAGLALAVAYLLLATYAHHLAFVRIERFAAGQNLQVEAIGALPLPPSLWHWDGLVRAPRGVYETRMDVSNDIFRSDANAADTKHGDAIERTYYPDALPNPYIEKARQLPDVQEVLWFARFPVTRFHKEGNEAVVEFLDLRFPQIRRDRPASFTYRVRFDANGNVISQGWVRN
jgi:membrane-bound metal-dependent hydrolase YbcI (DUF457 family)